MRRNTIHQDLRFLQTLAALPPPVRQVARRAWKQRRPYLLCGGTQAALGIFVPNDPPQWGIPPGMQSACVYSLCKACMALPDKGDRAEAIVWATRHEDLARARAAWN
jgi:hypothetical protein